MAIHIQNEELPGARSRARSWAGTTAACPCRFFVQASPPGPRSGPHTHPYAEVFVLHEGSGSFLAGEETIEASGGSVVVVPAGEVHGFTASGDGPLRMTCIHTNHEMVTEWVQPR